MHAKTVPAAEEPIFRVISKETSVPEVSCVVLGWWEGLCNPELVVKSCLSKSEVMFFFLWSKSLARLFQLLRAGENSKKGNVLAAEMRWKPTNMLSQSGTQDKSLVPNLLPPLTSAADLMAQSVVLFKMSYQGTLATSI